MKEVVRLLRHIHDLDSAHESLEEMGDGRNTCINQAKLLSVEFQGRYL